MNNFDSLESQSSFVLQASNVSKRFHDGLLDVTVLQNLDLEIAHGQTLAIVGASGAGKSTLLHLLGGLDTPTTGQICLMGRNWADMDMSQQGAWRNQHLGFVYQFHHLLPEFSAAENVAMPLWIRGTALDVARQRAVEVLTQVGMAHRLEHRPSELSGGERQRVAIARSLVGHPACVMADEPTGNLDRANARVIFDLMLTLAKAHATAFVVVTHDEQLAARCDRTFVLSPRLPE